MLVLSNLNQLNTIFELGSRLKNISTKTATLATAILVPSTVAYVIGASVNRWQNPHSTAKDFSPYNVKTILAGVGFLISNPLLIRNLSFHVFKASVAAQLAAGIAGYCLEGKW